MSFNRLLTCPKALSAVPISRLARVLLEIALSMLVMSARNVSLAINPAGSSLPELIRKPVLSRVSDCCKSAELRARVFCATKELTFVLIRVMPVHPLLV